jgi:hypothetical protein
MLTKGKHAGRALVLTVANRAAGAVKLRVITPNRLSLAVSSPDFDDLPGDE